MRLTLPVGILTIAICFSVLIVGCSKGMDERQLFEQAKKYQEENNFAAAVESYEALVNKYPQSRQAPQCLFMLGYLYANHLDDLDKARTAYETFLEKYPEDPLVKDARWELSHLGQDVNEIPELNTMLQGSADSLSGTPDSGTSPPE
ncbi:tetratricopeptide repeat protein [bacterium]|nr:tetratricopeptide repeat protein [bacterium]MBU1935870.1 tetratricopeptide repeat protein [bacterium]